MTLKAESIQTSKMMVNTGEWFPCPAVAGTGRRRDVTGKRTLVRALRST